MLVRLLSLTKPPRLPEILFAAVLIWLFATGQGWTVLLADGDTGWHIRNGERIIDTRTVPHVDPFSFGSDGHPWFSWEWMSDILFATLFRQGGLKAVAVFCGIMVAGSVSLLFKHMVWRSAGVCIALPIALLAAGASSIHYLARPHVIGLFLFAMVAWMVDLDRSSPIRSAWALPVVLMLWANLHGSFLAGLAMLGLRFVETGIEWWRESNVSTRSRVARAAKVLVLSSAATFCNPYSWHLHAHAIAYLHSAWIQATVEEFQSPRFRSENMFQYEILLMAGLAAMPWLYRQREIYPCCVILLWAHESLASVRHVPLYCLAACPFMALWIQQNWDRCLRGCRPDSYFRAIDAINSEWKPWTSGITIWPLVLCMCVGASAVPIGFPSNKFPTKLLDRNLLSFTSGDGCPQRVFSSDQWGDYLIFRLYPQVRVFFDGRSDFYGPWRGSNYLELMQGGANSLAILDSERVQWALLPREWALSGILRSCPRWRVADQDEQAILFEQKEEKIFSALIKTTALTDRCTE